MHHYRKKHALYPALISAEPPAGLKLIVVIPCYNEPDLSATLESLWQCERPACAVEVIIVINGSSADDSVVRRQNHRTLVRTIAWSEKHRDPGLVFHPVYLPDLPNRHAGVGLARKIGMDEALARFYQAGQRDGVIVSLDADCICRRDYLTAVAGHFAKHRTSSGCSIYFEHAVDDVADQRRRQGMIEYELYLRYYRHGLRYAGLPYAFHTLGSCMAVRAAAYAREGGMNRRQGGEDFYFLQKIIRLGNFTELTATTVFPGTRVSTRAPFGTGRALADWMRHPAGAYPVCNPQVFRDLRYLAGAARRFYAADPADGALLCALPAALAGFLARRQFPARLREIQRNSASLETFTLRLFRWFDALRAWQYVRAAGAGAYPPVAIGRAAAQLLGCTTGSPRSLLQRYRRIDREPGNGESGPDRHRPGFDQSDHAACQPVDPPDGGYRKQDVADPVIQRAESYHR